MRIHHHYQSTGRSAKSDFVDCLSKVNGVESFNVYEKLPVDAYIIDGPAFVHIIRTYTAIIKSTWGAKVLFAMFADILIERCCIGDGFYKI